MHNEDPKQKTRNDEGVVPYIMFPTSNLEKGGI